MVQCELQQDYDHGSGADAHVDETRSKAVYMIHVHAENANKTVRPNERYQIFASDHATVCWSGARVISAEA